MNKIVFVHFFFFTKPLAFFPIFYKHDSFINSLKYITISQMNGKASHSN